MSYSLRHRLVADLLKEGPTLFDAYGKPIALDAEHERLAAAELESLASTVADAIIRHIDRDGPGTTSDRPEPVSTAAKWSFSPHDGKLTTPLKLKVKGLELLGTIPLYK